MGYGVLCVCSVSFIVDKFEFAWLRGTATSHLWHQCFFAAKQRSKFRNKIIRLKQVRKGIHSITIPSATPDTSSSFSWVHLATGFARSVGVYHSSCQSPLRLGLFISECLRTPTVITSPRLSAWRCPPILCDFQLVSLRDTQEMKVEWTLLFVSHVHWFSAPDRRSDGVRTVSLVAPLWPDIVD